MILAIGDELLLGRTVDAIRRISRVGAVTKASVCTAVRLSLTMKQMFVLFKLLATVDLVLITGAWGPPSMIARATPWRPWGNPFSIRPVPGSKSRLFTGVFAPG